METQTRLSRHNKFILVENITIFSVSSDDYIYIYIYIYVYIYNVCVYMRKMNNFENQIDMFH